MVGIDSHSKFNRLNRSERTEKFKKLLFKHLLRRFVLEQEVPIYVAGGAIMLQYGILALFPTTYDLSDATLLAVVSIWLALSIGTSLLYKRISIYMTIAFTYIVYPMMVWGCSVRAASLVTKTSPFNYPVLIMTAHAAVLLVSLACVILLVLVSSSIPSNSPISFACRSTFAINLCCMTFGQLLNALAVVGVSSVERVVDSIVCDLVLVANLYNCSVRPTYWNHSIRKINMVGIILHLCCKIFTQLDMAFGVQEYWHVGVVLLVIVAKGILLFISRIDGRNPFSRGISSFKQLHYAFNMVTGLKETSWNIQKLVYSGMWSQYTDAEKFSLNTLFEYLSDHFERSKGSGDADSSHLKLLIMKPQLTLKDIRLVYYKLARQTKNSQGIFSQFDTYAFKKIFESKIASTHRMPPNKRQIYVEKYNWGTNFFEELLYYLDQEHYSIKKRKRLGYFREDRCYLGLERPFDDMALYNDAKDLICKELEIKEQIFKTLEADTKVCASALYRLNHRGLDAKNHLMKVYKAFNFEQVDRSSYTYPLFMYYFGFVRNKPSKSEEIFTQYKNKLNRLYRQKGKDTLKVSEDAISNSATFQVSLGENDIGQILHASVNYFEFLGHPKNGTALGSNINDMLPLVLGSRHRHAMGTMRNITSLSMHSKVVFVVGFDDLLRQTQLLVRVWPNIDSCVSAVVRLSFNFRSQNSMALVDSKLKIIQADTAFWSYFDKFEVPHEFGNINQLTKQINTARRILNIAKQIEERALKLSNTENRTDQHQGPETLNDLASTVGGVNNKMAKMSYMLGDLQKVYQCLLDFVKANSTFGIKYSVSSDSMFAPHIMEEGFICSIEPFEKLDCKLIKLLFKFNHESKGTLDTNLSMQSQPNPVKTDNKIKNNDEKYIDSGWSHKNFDKEGARLLEQIPSIRTNTAAETASSFEDLLAPGFTLVQEIEVRTKDFNFRDEITKMLPNVDHCEDEVRLLVEDCKRVLIELYEYIQPEDESINRTVKQTAYPSTRRFVTFDNFRPEDDSFIEVGLQEISQIRSRMISEVNETPLQLPSHRYMSELTDTYRHMLSDPEGPAFNLTTRSVRPKKHSNQASRQTNRGLQRKLMSQEKIVVASSNLIGKILNKVMVGID